MAQLYIALIHYPVVNKNGQTIASALTNLDLHDISRATKTFGLKAFFVVTPLEDQIDLIQKIISHWTQGIGAQYNPKRRSALEMIHVSASYADVIDRVAISEGMQPKTIATCARAAPANTSYEKCRAMLKNDEPYVLALGTAWGLSDTEANSWSGSKDWISTERLRSVRLRAAHLSTSFSCGYVRLSDWASMEKATSRADSKRSSEVGTNAVPFF